MAIIDGRTIKWAEYVDETTMGTTPSNPTMVAFPGDLEKAELTSGPEIDVYRALQGASVTDPLSCGETVRTGETHAVKITVRCNSLAWLPYVLMATNTTTYAVGNTPHYVSIGIKADDQYCVFSGCLLHTAEFNFPDMKSSCTLVLTYICKDKTDWSLSSYIGTGSHATASTDDPYTMSDLSSVLYDSSAPSVSDILLESLKFTISYDYEPVTDLSESAPSKIGDYAFMSRSIQLDMGMTMMAMGAHNDVLTATDHEVMFTLDSKTFKFTDLKWTNSPTVDLSPSTKVGMTFTSDGDATRLEFV
jgi:hypothetical protein